MKIVLPVNDDRKTICQVLGRAPYFLLYDSDRDVKLFAQNPAAEEESGAGPKSAQFIVDLGADVLLTPRCGENSAKVFEAAELAIYRSEGESIEDNLNAYKENRLSKLEKFHGGYHGIK